MKGGRNQNAVEIDKIALIFVPEGGERTHLQR